MSTQNTNPVPTPSRQELRQSVIEQLVAQEKQVAYALIGIGLALLAIPIGVSYAYGSNGAHISIWGGVLAALALLAGSVLLTPVTGQITPTERMRLVLLTLGGASGFFTALLGLILPFTDPFQEVFTGGFLEWRKNPWPLIWVGLALLGGLLLMFLSLQLARGLERSHAVLRRLVYGYNAVVSSLLLFIILALVNVLSYVTLWPFDVMGQTIDWTKNRQFTLNEGFVKLLKDLDQPVQVYGIVMQSNIRLDEIESLLRNARDTAPRYFHYEILSRDSNFTKVAELQKKFNFFDPNGLLVVYGDESGKPAFDFIPASKLEDPRRRFIGENALYQSIDYLTQGSKKPSVYFTQGNGELSLKETPDGRPTDSLSGLVELLSTGNYEPKELTYDGKETVSQLTDRLIKEADVVVVARPTRPLPQPLITALRNYSNGTGAKRGKLMLLFDSIFDQDGKMVQTGLEPLLEENRIRLRNDRLICPTFKEARLLTPLQILGIADLNSAKNPIVSALGSGDEGRVLAFRFQNARSLEILPPNVQGGPAMLQTESIIQIPRNFLVWGSTNLNGDPMQMAAERLRNETELEKTYNMPALTIAASVALSQSPQMPPGMPPDHPAPTGTQRPVMVVFSDATWVSNLFLDTRQRERTSSNWTLFANCLTWLRERPDLGVKIDPRERDIFEVSPEVRSKISLFRLLILPGILMLVAVIGLGVGVWVVRRR